IKKPNGWGVALDACRICGAEGYRQDGQNVVCRHCASAIFIPSIGDQGGCNPIGVAARLDGGDIVIDISGLAEKSKEIPRYARVSAFDGRQLNPMFLRLVVDSLGRRPRQKLMTGA